MSFTAKDFASLIEEAAEALQAAAHTIYLLEDSDDIGLIELEEIYDSLTNMTGDCTALALALCQERELSEEEMSEQLHDAYMFLGFNSLKELEINQAREQMRSDIVESM